MKSTFKRSMVIASPSHARGFTLIELMVGLTLGMVLILAATTFFLSNSSALQSGKVISAQQNDARHAIGVIKRSLQESGFRNLTAGNVTTTGVISSVTNDCAASFAINLTQPVFGTDDANAFGATCVPTAMYSASGGDVLALRSLSQDPVNLPVGTTSIYINAGYGQGIIFSPASVTTTVPSVVPPSAVHQLESDIFFVGKYSVSSTENPQIPALYRVRLGDGPAYLAPELVAPGIDSLQVQYGIDSAGGKTQFVDAGAVTNWDQVKSVRVWLLSRSLVLDPGYNPGTRTFTLGTKDIQIAPADRYRREMYSVTVALRNNL